VKTPLGVCEIRGGPQRCCGDGEGEGDPHPPPLSPRLGWPLASYPRFP